MRVLYSHAMQDFCIYKIYLSFVKHMPIVVDQLQREVSVPEVPRRIISLVPSQTELLAYLGLDQQVVGITKFCVHPKDWGGRKAIVGGTKKLDIDLIEGLKPDLIIANKEENNKEDITLLAKRYPVWVSDVVTLSDAYTMIKMLGDLSNTSTKAIVLVQRIEDRFAKLKSFPAERVLYLIWRKPWMAAGQHTFINSMLEEASFKNVIDADRYPVLNDEDIVRLNPSLVFLTSEPYPFKEKHQLELQQILPMAKVIFVDGEMFSWYGSRLLQFTDYLPLLIKQLKT